MKQLLIFIFAVFAPLTNFSQDRQLDNIFYCFNNGVRELPNAPVTLADQADLIRKLGFDGLGGHSTQDNEALRAALDNEGLLMPEIYYGMIMDENGSISYPPELRKMIESSKDRDLLVALTLTGKSHMNQKIEADKLFVPEIRKLADFAALYDVEIAIYPHADFYCEESLHSVVLAKAVNRNNVGVIFNTCHFLKVEGEAGWKEKATKTLPYLKMVSINGTDSGDTKTMGWERLIQPLGEGTFNTYALVKFLKDHGFDGKFGLQCYNIKQDCEVALGKSIKTWKAYQNRYAAEQTSENKGFSKSLREALVTISKENITVSTGKIQRVWEWTGSGFATLSYRQLKSCKEWCQAAPSYKADWDLPTKIGDESEGELISVNCIESDDEKFTSNHLLVTAIVRYSCGIDLKFLIRVYPKAPGIWTALEVRATNKYSSDGIPEDIDTYKYYGSRQPVKIARSEFIPVDFSTKNRRRYWGIYNDPGNRVNTKDMVKEKVIEGWPIFQDEQNTWASGLSIESGGEGLILVKESNKTVNKYGHQTGSFYCTPRGVEVTGWGLKPGEITREYRRAWANWTILFSGEEDEMELALKQFDRLRFPLNIERDMHILIDTWGSDHQNGEDEKIYGKENSVYGIVSEEVKTASRMGIDIVRIDDGWQQGHPFGKAVWLPAPEAGYQHGWKKLNKLADEYKVRIGLWAAIRYISPEEMRINQKDLNVATWKLDFDKLPDWETFNSRMRQIRSFIKDSDHKTQVSWCPEYDDQRYGWYSPAKEYGPMYFQNIQNNMPNHIVYVPYITLRGHWRISRFYNMNKLQCHWQNPALTNPAFSDARLHSQSYCALSAFMALPSCFMLTQLLEPEQEAELTKIIGLYKAHRREIFEGYVFPIGDEPDNSSWAGFQIYHPDKKSGYLMIFRELHNKENNQELQLKFVKDKNIHLTDLENPENSPGSLWTDDGKIGLYIDDPAGYLFMKYEIRQ